MATSPKTAVATLAVLTSVLSACSDDGGEPGPAATPTSDPAADAEAAVTGFYEDLAAGELASACAWWTERYAASSIAEWNDGGYGPQVRTCPDLLRAIREVFAIVGEPSDLLQVTEVDGELTDDTTAQVEVMLASDDEDSETYEVTLTDEGWRISGDDTA
jgi:hypothetical protein